MLPNVQVIVLGERLSEYGMGMIEYAIMLTVNELF